MEQRIGKMVLQLANELIKKRNEASSRFNLTAGQMTFLVFLLRHQDRPEINQLDIEKEFGLTHQTVTGIISRLKSKGFVICSSSERDKRYKAIRPTSQAFALSEELERLTQEADALMTQSMTEVEQSAFHDLLQVAMNHLMKPSEARNPNDR